MKKIENAPTAHEDAIIRDIAALPEDSMRLGSLGRHLASLSLEDTAYFLNDLYKNEHRMIDLCNEIVRRRLGITWDATNGLIAASCTNEVIAASAESG
ncbi:MAG: hypothetical protein AAB356_07245, partial [Deltaproteobacteria bacterium]